MILKICGIAIQDDASAAIEAGATAIGFNFYARSPRYIRPEVAGEIVTAPGVRRVGVFVNEDRDRIAEVARAARLDVAQLHGDETPADYPVELAVWKAVRVDAAFDFAHYRDPAEALLLDGPAGELYGGSGKHFDWSVARHTSRRIVLAGGLDASNVALAIELVRPWGVDACSRIESAPGRKDRRKMMEFLQAAMAAVHA
ncbi:MAG TPA: phosphoribosylanthranilate isomerase [Bryobacteraceae bacterium]|jgi:phosphoribosylanthranilate isomerase|nr:phosphoribosylanthranilate isomerase [Bryobacteraceae bacterium]